MGSIAAQMTSNSIRSRFIPQLRNSAFFFSCKAGAGENLSCNGAPTSVPVGVAHKLLQEGHRYLDVRTLEEFKAGRVSDATNVPYMFRIGSGMTKNPKFLEEISVHFNKDNHIIVGCQSGKRSLMAADDLQSDGYTNITDMAGGFTAWAQNGFPIDS